MKPRNFPGRKHARRVRAQRTGHVPEWRTGKGARTSAAPTVKDIRWRIGAANRDPQTGIAR